MKAPVEERLRQALAQQAETTTTTPEAWRQIQARRAGARRPALVRWTLLAPAAAVAAVLILLAVVAGDDDNRTLRVTGESDALHLMPTGVEPRFRLVNVMTTEPGGPAPPTTFRAFGRRGPDGVALQASVVITIPGDMARNGATPEPSPLRVLGQDVMVGTNPVGQRVLRWYQPDGREVGLVTYGLSQAEVVRVVESLVLGDASTDAPSLPPGLAPLGTGALPGEARPVAIQSWDSANGARFTVVVVEETGATLDRVALSMPGGRARNVRGTTAIYVPAGDGYLTWLERPHTVVSLQGQGLSEEELLTIAQGLRPVSDAEWRALEDRYRARPPDTIGPVPDIGPPPGAVPPTNNYFLLLPVRGRSAPPCPSSPLVFPEQAAGQDVVCYQVAGPLVDADDVDTAVAREERGTGGWAVEYTLTPAGVASMEALFRDVGAGGQFAIVVDGRLVSAPRLEGPPPPKGIVSGLDEQTARSLADRLTR
jgi:hypothetical protein